MPGTVQQELERILRKQQEAGVKTVWLNDANLSAMSVSVGKYGGATAASAPMPQPALAPQVAVAQPQVVSMPQVSSVSQQTSASQSVSCPSPSPSGIVASPGAGSVSSTERSEGKPQVSREQIMEASMEDLRQLVGQCGACVHGAECRNRIFLASQSKVRVLFVGDYPTGEEESTGRPFTGAAGEMLYKMGMALGLKWEGGEERNSAGYLTVLKCKPSTPPTAGDIGCCLPILQRQIELLQPEAMVLMGLVTVRALLNWEDGFSKVKGSLLDYRGVPAVVIQSPTQIVRVANQKDLYYSERAAAWATLQKLLPILGK